MIDYIQYIKQYINLSEDTLEELQKRIKTITLKKGTVFLKEGQTCPNLYFVKQGAVRSYFYKNGKDITHWIYDINSLVTSWTSYFTKQAAHDYLETTTDTIIEYLSFDDWEELYKVCPELNVFTRKILEEQISIIDHFYKGFYFLSAKEKYELLISFNSNIIQQANLGHIASMLGITQETLSRIRNKK